MKFIQVEFSAIVTDFEKSNRFGRMLLLDVPDHKLLTLANEIPETKTLSSPINKPSKQLGEALQEESKRGEEKEGEVGAGITAITVD